MEKQPKPANEKENPTRNLALDLVFKLRHHNLTEG